MLLPAPVLPWPGQERGGVFAPLGLLLFVLGEVQVPALKTVGGRQITVDTERAPCVNFLRLRLRRLSTLYVNLARYVFTCAQNGRWASNRSPGVLHTLT
jgi:hypothetical protein